MAVLPMFRASGKVFPHKNFKNGVESLCFVGFLNIFEFPFVDCLGSTRYLWKVEEKIPGVASTRKCTAMQGIDLSQTLKYAC